MFTASEILTPQYQQWAKTVKRKGAICTRCKGQHWDPLFKMCKTCRALNWDQLYEWRQTNRTKGLCMYCVEEIDGDRSVCQCEYHLDWRNEYVAKKSKQQKRQGLCRVALCRERPDEGYLTCQKHLASKKRQRGQQQAA